MTVTSRRAVLAGTATGLALAGPAAAFDIQKMLGSPQTQQLLGGVINLGKSLMMGEQEEIQLGNQYYPGYVQKSGGAVNDRNVQAAVQAFAQPFIATSERQLPWEITVVESKDVNAWALPGGKLAVNSALISYCDDPAELGSVIAHEIGHSELSHGVQSMRTQGFIALLSSGAKLALSQWVEGGAGALTTSVFSALEGPVYQLVNAGYSRSREHEADAHILQVFEKTGQDPAKADDFFNTLQSLYPQNTDLTTSLFSTHPGTADRIERLQAAAAQLPKTGRTETPQGWAALKERYPTPTAFKRG